VARSDWLSKTPRVSRPAAQFDEVHTDLVGRVRAKVRALTWRVMVNGVLRSGLIPRHTRARAYALAGMKIGAGVGIRERVEVDWPYLTVGDRVFISADVTVDNHAPVTIGDDVLVAPGVLITTTNHLAEHSYRRAGRNIYRPVTIHRGSWIGARAVILQGVTIGSGCIVAAGAVVTADCAANGLYAGIPARRVRDLPDGPEAALPGPLDAAQQRDGR
jgi:maltose O-acetyltransferase